MEPSEAHAWISAYRSLLYTHDYWESFKEINFMSLLLLVEVSCLCLGPQIKVKTQFWMQVAYFGSKPRK